MTKRFVPNRRFRRGNAAVVGLSLGVVLGFGALAVDISLQRVADVQVQAAIEAAVLGGAARIDRTIPGLFEARNQAVEIANKNPVVGDWNLTPEDVEVGVYDPDTDTFTAVDPNTLQTGEQLVLDINALRIATTHDGIAAVLANAAFGVDSMSTSNTAMAMRPNQGGAAKNVPCYLPLAIPDCDYKEWMGGGTMPTENPPPRMFNQTSSIVDNIGWGRPQPKDNPNANQTPNTSYIQGAFVNNGCHDDSIELGQHMEVANGQNTSVLKYIDDILTGKEIPLVTPSAWDYEVAPRPARDGVEANLPGVSSLPPNVWSDEPVIEGPVALMKMTDAQCASNINFVGNWEISGFAWAMIYDVAQPSTKNVWIQLDFINERDFGGAVDEDGMGPVTGFDNPMLVF